jgi:hypothetical protein
MNMFQTLVMGARWVVADSEFSEYLSAIPRAAQLGRRAYRRTARAAVEKSPTERVVNINI